jgi:hypothetical protein
MSKKIIRDSIAPVDGTETDIIGGSPRKKKEQRKTSVSNPLPSNVSTEQ